jgi:hypothetical protein
VISVEVNGEHRKWVALTIGGAVLTALGTELAKWGVEEAKRRWGHKPEVPKTRKK